MTTNVWEDLKARGFVYQSTDEKALEKALAEGPITYYVGFDPTGDSLHVGHLLPVMCMRWLQKAGHHPIALVGGATGLVGDPSSPAKKWLRTVKPSDSSSAGSCLMTMSLWRTISTGSAR